MENKGIQIGICSQKGGVGKTTYTVLIANALHYKLGYDLTVIDADYPQWSIHQQRERELKIIQQSDYYKSKLIAQFEATGKKMWPIYKSSPDEVIRRNTQKPVVGKPVCMIDLPGSIGSSGMLTTLANMDYIFIPLKADKIVMESSLAFAHMINENFAKSSAYSLRGVFLFWTMIDRREKTALYGHYETVITKLGLSLLNSHIPLRTKFNKEITETPSPVYRSTVFLSDNRFLEDCRIDDLAGEISNFLTVREDV